MSGERPAKEPLRRMSGWKQLQIALLVAAAGAVAAWAVAWQSQFSLAETFAGAGAILVFLGMAPNMRGLAGIDRYHLPHPAIRAQEAAKLPIPEATTMEMYRAQVLSIILGLASVPLFALALLFGLSA